MNTKRKKNIIISCAYLLLIGLLVFYLFKFFNVYNNADELNASNVEKEIFEIIYSDYDEELLVREIEASVNKYDYDIVIMKDENLIYSSIPYYEGDTLEPRVNRMQISLSSAGEYPYGDGNEELFVWYTIYKINDSSLLNIFISILSITNIIVLMILSLTVYLIITRYYLPIKKIKKSIDYANHYDFEHIEEINDDLNKQFKRFVNDLETDLSTVSRKHTELEKRLQAKREYLNNILIVSRSMVHDLKTPIHRNILVNEAKAKDYPDNDELKELALLNQSLNDEIMKDINRILGVLKNDGFKMKLEIKDVDVVALIEKSLNSFKQNMLKKELILDLDAPEHLTISTEETTFILLINNLLSNMILYAKENTEVKVFVDQSEDSLILSFYNKATSEDIASMLKSKTMFNEVKHPESGEYVYRSGNGLFLIKELTAMLNAEYVLETDQDSVFIKVIIHY